MVLYTLGTAIGFALDKRHPTFPSIFVHDIWDIFVTEFFPGFRNCHFFHVERLTL